MGYADRDKVRLIIMKAIGYIYRAQMIPPDQLQHIELVMNDNRAQTVDSVLTQLHSYVETFVDDIESESAELSKFVDCVNVRVGTNRPGEFLDLINQSTFDAILVPSFDTLSPLVTQQYELISHARGDLFPSEIQGFDSRKILVVSLEQTSLLKLDLDLAFELQEQWILAPMRKTIDEVHTKSDDNYSKLRDLMLEKLTVEKIAERLGQSKSTIFRWRKQFEDRLAVDIPGFKIGD